MWLIPKLDDSGMAKNLISNLKNQKLLKAAFVSSYNMPSK
jgi:hypothetical protein